MKARYVFPALERALLAILFCGVACRAGSDEHDCDPGRPFELQAFVDGELSAGEKRIVIPPGRYRVTPKRRQHLLLANVADVKILADGVEMICTETTRAVTIHGCRNLAIRGLVIDYDPLPYTQGRIVALSDDKQVHDIELFDGYPRGSRATAWKYEIFRPDTRTLRFGSYHGFRLETVGPRHLRVIKDERHRRNTFKPEQLGDIAVIAAPHAPGGSIPHAVYANGCSDLRLEGVVVHASNCFGFLEENCEGSTYQRCRVDRRPADSDLKPRADTRIRSLNADAFHSKHAVKGPALIECVARFMGDDCININGDYHLVTHCKDRVLRVLAKRTLNIAVGDPVELTAYTGERLPDAQVASVRRDGEATAAERDFVSRQAMDADIKALRHGSLTKAYRVELDRPVELPMGSVIASLRRTGRGFRIEGCDFGHNRSRGILIKASDGDVINNTLVGNWGKAVMVAPEYWWLEAGSACNVRIAGNTIDDCHSVGIAVYARSGQGRLAPPGAHTNIVIERNCITGSPMPNILVTSTRGLRLDGNRAEPSSTRALLPWERHALGLRDMELGAMMTLDCEERETDEPK
jgi:hypothetical protein